MSAGDIVHKGQILMTVEGMKMEVIRTAQFTAVHVHVAACT